MPWLYYILFIVSTCLFSCSRNTVQLLDISSNSEDVEYIDGLEYAKCATENFDVHVAFVEDVSDILVFRCIVENFSDDSIRVRNEDFELSFYDRFDDPNEAIVPSIYGESRIDFLESEKGHIEEAKKNRVFGGVLFAGLEAVAVAISPGGNVGSAILYAAESGAYIAEERNRFKLAELSIEDEIQYIEDWVLNEATIGAYEDMDFDLLYERIYREGDLLFKVDIAGEYCELDFNQVFD